MRRSRRKKTGKGSGPAKTTDKNSIGYTCGSRHTESHGCISARRKMKIDGLCPGCTKPRH